MVYQSPDTVREILIHYVSQKSKHNDKLISSLKPNWQLVSIAGSEDLSLIFETSPEQKASDYIVENAQYNMVKSQINEAG